MPGFRAAALLLLSPAQVLSLRGSTLEDPDSCMDVAPNGMPGFCNTAVSGFACYSTEAEYSPKAGVSVPVQWACSTGLGLDEGMTDDSCQERVWKYKGTVAGQEVEFTAPAGIYKGVCAFHAKPSEEHSSTTPASDSPNPAEDKNGDSAEGAKSSTSSAPASTTTTTQQTWKEWAWNKVKFW